MYTAARQEMVTMFDEIGYIQLIDDIDIFVDEKLFFLFRFSHRCFMKSVHVEHIFRAYQLSIRQALKRDRHTKRSTELWIDRLIDIIDVFHQTHSQITMYR